MIRSTVSAAIRACTAEVADPDRSMESTLFSDSGFMPSGSATSLVVQANSFLSRPVMVRSGSSTVGSAWIARCQPVYGHVPELIGGRGELVIGGLEVR